MVECSYILEVAMDGSGNKRLFAFPALNPGDKGFYRSVTTQNAFFRNRNRTNRRLFRYYFPDERDLVNYDGPAQELKSLYHFFELIGFDRKTRKYTNEGEKHISRAKKRPKQVG